MSDWGSLLDRAREGDGEAWDALLKRLRPLIWALCRRRLYADDEASDLTQDVLLGVTRGFARFRGVTVMQLLAWIRTIIARRLIDHGRRTPPPAGPLPPTLGGPSGGGPLSSLVGAEDMARLAAALPKLPEHYRAVIEARLFEGLSCAAIAQRLGRTRVWVSVTCMRAVERLRNDLRNEL
jgi:RNA polymerase sigma-70 factor (ECF subfamily)